MIKHHPTFELIQAFVNGELPASLSAGIAIHASMCPKCQQQISLLTNQVAQTSFEDEYLDPFITDDNYESDKLNFEAMIEKITQSNEIVNVNTHVNNTVVFNEKSYQLPHALINIPIGKTASIGKLSRARLHLEEHEIHTSLLHIEPKGSVPEHTHKGFELTLLLDGTFHDEKGEYVKGDFIMLDGTHQHNPVSDYGCLCYTVANGALHFTKGMNKLLNPIGAFIY